MEQAVMLYTSTKQDGEHLEIMIQDDIGVECESDYDGEDATHVCELTEDEIDLVMEKFESHVKFDYV